MPGNNGRTARIRELLTRSDKWFKHSWQLSQEQISSWMVRAIKTVTPKRSTEDARALCFSFLRAVTAGECYMYHRREGQKKREKLCQIKAETVRKMILRRLTGPDAKTVYEHLITRFDYAARTMLRPLLYRLQRSGRQWDQGMKDSLEYEDNDA